MPGLLPFHMGAFLAAAESGAAIVPVALRGTRSILRDGSWFPRKGKISVVIGKPIQMEKQIQKAEKSWKVALSLRSRARDHILQFCGEPDLAYEKSKILDLKKDI